MPMLLDGLHSPSGCDHSKLHQFLLPIMAVSLNVLLLPSPSRLAQTQNFFKACTNPELFQGLHKPKTFSSTLFLFHFLQLSAKEVKETAKAPVPRVWGHTDLSTRSHHSTLVHDKATQSLRPWYQPAKEVKGSAERALLVRMVQRARVARRAWPRQLCVESDKQHKHSLWGLRLAESDTFSCGAARKGVKRQAVSTGHSSSTGHGKICVAAAHLKWVQPEAKKNKSQKTNKPNTKTKKEREREREKKEESSSSKQILTSCQLHSITTGWKKRRRKNERQTKQKEKS